MARLRSATRPRRTTTISVLLILSWNLSISILQRGAGAFQWSYSLTSTASYYRRWKNDDDGRRRRHKLTSFSSLSSSSEMISEASVVIDEIDDRIRLGVKRREDIESLIERLEDLYDPEQRKEPNRSGGSLDLWCVHYTDGPPPSNGMLGPFRGTSEQVIYPGPTCRKTDDGNDGDRDGDNNSYQNVLRVPPNDWLTAKLDGVWEEWDGVPLPREDGVAVAVEKDGDAKKKNAIVGVDYGRNHWKVTFLNLSIVLFNSFKIFSLNFDPPGSACRIWKTTYLDDKVRVVRASRTGLKEDERIFYTKRERPKQP